MAFARRDIAIFSNVARLARSVRLGLSGELATRVSSGGPIENFPTFLLPRFAVFDFGRQKTGGIYISHGKVQSIFTK